MKTTLLLFLLVTGLRAQNFTNGSVLDFSVGDTIMTRITNYPTSYFPGPPTDVYNVVLAKRYSSNLDTVFYTMFGYMYTPPACFTCSPKTDTTTFVLRETNLNASAIAYSLPTHTCQTQFDSSYINKCGLHEHVKTLRANPPPNGCFEASSRTDWIIEGVGRLGFTQCWSCLPTGKGQKTELVAVHKVNGVHCGNTSFVIAGIGEVSSVSGTEIFPNPFESTIYVKVNKECKVIVINNLGQCVKNSLCFPGTNSIDLGDCTRGVYFLRLIQDNATITRKLIKN